MTARSTSTSMHVNPAAQNYERAVSGGDKRGLLEEGKFSTIQSAERSFDVVPEIEKQLIPLYICSLI